MIRALYKKEMLDILRDKKTMLITVFVPLILYPLLFLGGLFVAMSVLSNQQSAAYRVAFVGISDKAAIQEVMKMDEKAYGYHFKIVEPKGDGMQQLKDKKIDLCVLEKRKGGQLEFQLKYLSSVTASATAASHMQDVLMDYEEKLQEKSVIKAGLDVEKVLHPIAIAKTDLSSKKENAGNVLGTIVPFLLISSILMGAIYPAIDTTAGEKERGTLETLLTLPVSNFQMIMSKFLAVSSVAVVSALLNLLSITVFGGIFYQMFLLKEKKNIAIDWMAFLPVFGFLMLGIVVFALFMAAICLCICMFAKSFKEAQNYSTPLVVIVLVTGYIGFIPNVSLQGIFAVVPVANIVLLIKNALSFQLEFRGACIVLFSNLAYSFLAVLLMSKIYHSERILFGEGGSVHLFERRANIKKGQIPGIGDAFLLLSVTLLLSFYLGSYVLLRWGAAGVVIQQIFFLLVVLTFSWYMKVDWKRLFSIKMPKLRAIIGAILLWCGVYLLMLPANIEMEKLFPKSAETLRQTNQMFGSHTFVWMFLVVALLPAICEEVLFRGFLFGTFRAYWNTGVAILTTAIIFAGFHMSMVEFLSISILGCAMAYAVHCSKSIVTAMLMHLCNNGLAVCMLAYPRSAQRILSLLHMQDGKADLSQLPFFVGSGLLLATVGIIWLKKEKMTVNELR